MYSPSVSNKVNPEFNEHPSYQEYSNSEADSEALHGCVNTTARSCDHCAHPHSSHFSADSVIKQTASLERLAFR